MDRETADGLWDSHLKASRGIPTQPFEWVERKPTFPIMGMMLVLLSTAMVVLFILWLVR